MAREDWLVQVVVHATRDEVEAMGDRIGAVICAPADHEGRCDTPWTMVTTALSQLDDEERRALAALLDDER